MTHFTDSNMKFLCDTRQGKNCTLLLVSLNRWVKNLKRRKEPQGPRKMEYNTTHWQAQAQIYQVGGSGKKERVTVVESSFMSLQTSRNLPDKSPWFHA